MNVLVIVPSSSFADDALLAWKRLSGSHSVSFLSCIASGESGTQTPEMLPLEFDVERPRAIWRLLMHSLQRLPRLGRWFWHGGIFLLVMRGIWPDFEFHIRSFDPDIVDLRRMPGSRVLKRWLTKTGPFVVLAHEDTFSPDEVDTSWRLYDPSLKVSVILPVYNGARYLAKAIESCLEQTHRSLELVVVDDCSTDETPEIIAAYAQRDSRVVVVHNERNLRLPGALNVGFARASGDLLTWTSCDNLYVPEAIEELVRYLCTWSDVDFVYSAFRYIDDLGKPTSEVKVPDPPWTLRFTNGIGACFLYRRGVYDEVGEYRTDMEYVEDYDYFVRIWKRFKMMRLNRSLYYYRRHRGSLSSQAIAAGAGEAVWGKVKREHFARR